MAKAKAQSVIQTDDDTLYYERCAGIDVHKNLLVVCMRIGRKTESREYGTTNLRIAKMLYSQLVFRKLTELLNRLLLSSPFCQSAK